MLTRLLAKLRNTACSLLHRTDGAVMPMFTITLVPMIGLVGASVEYSRANSIRTGLQASLDSAVLAAARDGTFNWKKVAIDTYNANLVTKGSSISAPVFTKDANGVYSGSASGTIPSSFLKVVGLQAIGFGARANAVGVGTPGQACVMALSSNAQPSLTLDGNAGVDIKAPNCVLQVNSNAFGAVYMNGNTTIKSAENCFVGTATKVGNATLVPAPDAECKPMPDPFSTLSKPAVGPCDYTNYSANGNQSITLNPGVYCGGMKFNAQVAVTFSPGLYVIKDGIIDAQGGASFTGIGVTFFLTGAGAGVDIEGSANWHLVASNDGPLAGFVFYLDPSSPTGQVATSSKLAGSAEMYFEGVVYLGRQQLQLTGSSSTATPSPYTAFIADTIEIGGSGTLTINNDLTKTSVKIPSALQMTMNTKARLVQ